MSYADLSITVYHDKPVGQGRIAFSRQGRGYHSNAKRLNPWRKAIVTETTRAIGHNWAPMTGPLTVQAHVTVPKPKSAPKRRRTWPTTRTSGDIDHHARALLDSLTAANVWVDDAQVTELCIAKSYPGEEPASLDRPGVRIHIWQQVRA